MAFEWMKFKSNENSTFFHKLKQKKIKKDQLLILFLLGVLLLVVALPTGKKSGAVQEKNQQDKGEDSLQELSNREYVDDLEQNLENVLEQMEGVGDATVMITLSESAEKVVEKDVETSSESVTEEDSQGGTRTTDSHTLGESTIFGGEKDGGFYGSSEDESVSNPYVKKEIAPRVEGVVVVASGGDNAVVVRNITESVKALFGIDTHKIRIVKKE